MQKTPAELGNDNLWTEALSKEVFELLFPRELKEKMVFADVTEMTPAGFNTKIERPTFALADGIQKGPWTCSHKGGSAMKLDTEFVIIDNIYRDSATYCDINVAHTKVGLGALLEKISTTIKRKIRTEINKDAHDLLVSGAGNTIGVAVGNEATAMQFIDEVIALYGGYEEDFRITAYVPHEMIKYFRAIATSRVGIMGDGVLRSGELIDVLGVTIKAISGSIITPANATKVVAVVGKPLTFYYDYEMEAMRTFEQPADVAAGEYASDNKILEVTTYGQLVLWGDDAQFISVSS